MLNLGTTSDKFSSWLKPLLPIVAAVLVGAAAGWLLLWVLAYGLTRLLFSAYLLDPAYIESLKNNAILGLLLGAVTGLVLATPPDQLHRRKVGAGLGVWIGASAVFPTLAFFFIAIVYALRGDGQLPSTGTPPSSAFLICMMLPVLLWGSLLLRWSLKVLITRSLNSLWADVKTDITGVCRPGSGPLLEHFTLHSPLSIEECVENLGQETESKAGIASRLLLWLPLPGRKPLTARIRPGKGKHIGTYACSLRRYSKPTWYDFNCRLSAKGEGTLVEGRSTLPVVLQAYNVFWFGFLALFTLIMFLSIAAYFFASLNGSRAQGQNPAWALLILVVMWLGGLVTLRFNQWRARQQELFIIEFLQQTMEVSLVEKHPQRKRFLLF